MPVFLAFYWVLLESVEMRQAPFFGWLNDLSSRDPYFILPALMAGAMLVQYKLNPTPPDPIQAKVFMFMPLVMSQCSPFSPQGLVLYWVTNTLLSIAQQWNINRRIGAAEAKLRRRTVLGCRWPDLRHHRRPSDASRPRRHRHRAPLGSEDAWHSAAPGQLPPARHATFARSSMRAAAARCGSRAVFSGAAFLYG
jgi:membrane protein insertase Oxa1/YidC/SpoIIIJ